MNLQVTLLVVLFALAEFKDGDQNRVIKETSQQSVEIPVQVMEDSLSTEVSDSCFTRSGCACLKQWTYRGLQFEECANPDSDYKSNWCQVDPTTCNNADNLRDSIKYYGYCSCKNDTASPSPVPSPSHVSSSMLPPQSDIVPGRNFLLMDSQDCLTIINTGCTQYHFFMTFTDGELIQSVEYFDYFFYQTSGWWMLDNVVGDYTRWCSPTKTIGLYFVVEDSREFDSSLETSKSIDSTFRCMNMEKEFEYLTYHYNRDLDGHSGTTTFTPFYVDLKTQVREPECSGIGGEFRRFQIIPKNTTLYVDESCQFVENF